MPVQAMPVQAMSTQPAISAQPLAEGLRGGDLADLVLPLLSVDEYESKVADDAVVFGFYVHDQDAAADLNRFLQKSAVPILDTDVSPAPDQQGFYLVFVELLDNARLAEHVARLVAELGPLVGITHWHMRVRGSSRLVRFTPAGLAQRLRQARTAPTRPDTARSDGGSGHGDGGSGRSEVLEFLVPSALADARLHGTALTLRGRAAGVAAEVAGFGPPAALLREHGLERAAWAWEFADLARCRRLARLLGAGWQVDRIADYVLVRHDDASAALLLRETHMV